MRGLPRVLIALAAKLHLNGFTLGRCLVAAIAHGLRREDNYSSLIFKNKAKPPGRVLCLTQKRGGVPGLCSRERALPWARSLPLARHRGSTPLFPGIRGREGPGDFQNFYFAFIQDLPCSLLLVLVCPLAASLWSVPQSGGGWALAPALRF